MVKIILILFISFAGLFAKSSVDACIPIGKIVILKKSIMSLDLSKAQKAKLLKYEKKLKEDLGDLKDSAYNKKERLSEFFSKTSFLRERFFEVTKKENLAISTLIAEYFQNMYSALTIKQRAKLIKRFKRIERKRKK